MKRSEAMEKKLRDALRLNLGKRKGQTRAWHTSKEQTNDHPSFWQETSQGVRLYARVSPGSTQNAIDGIYHGEHGRIWVKVTLKSPPEDQKANHALMVLVSDLLGIPQQTIKISAGVSSRLKTLDLPPLTADQKAVLNGWKDLKTPSDSEI